MKHLRNLTNGLVLAVAMGGTCHAQFYTKSVSDAIAGPVEDSGPVAGSSKASDFESINLFNGSLSFHLPLLEVGGRGEARYTMTLQIENRWDITERVFAGLSGDRVANLAGGNIPAGYGPGKLSMRYLTEETFCSNVVHVLNEYTYFSFSQPNGTALDFHAKPDLANANRAQVANYPCGYVGARQRNRGREFVTHDGTAATLYFPNDDILEGQGLAPGAYIMFRNGVRYDLTREGTVDRIRDRNGNKLSFEYSSHNDVIRVTDSLGRAVEISYRYVTLQSYDEIRFRGTDGAVRSIKVYSGELAQNLREGYFMKNYSELFPYLGLTPTPFSCSVVSQVQLPNGQTYDFKYNSHCEPAYVKVPTGGQIHYDIEQATNNLFGLADRRVTARREKDRNLTAIGDTLYTYGLTLNGVGETVATAEMRYRGTPSGGGEAELAKETHVFWGTPSRSAGPMDFPYWKLGKEEEIRTAQRKTAQFWAQAQQTPAWLGQFGNRENDPYVERTEVTMLDVGGAQPPVQKRTRYVYDQYNNVRFIREHQPSDDALLRETERTYKTDAGYTGLNAHLRALLASETVRSGGGTILSRTDYDYDNYPVVSRAGAIGYEAWRADLRGNLTRVERVLSYLGDPASALTTEVRYDELGNVVKVKNGRGKEISYEYADKYSASTTLPVGSTFAFVTQVTPPAVNGLAVSTKLEQYDRYLGKPLQFTDATGGVTSYAFQDPLGRLTGITRPDGSTVSVSYNDPLGRVRRSQTQNSCEVASTVAVETDFDGFGRKGIERAIATECSAGIETHFQYDGKGRLARVSNPGCGLSGQWTSTTYDDLDRVRMVTYPDGASVETKYSGMETRVKEDGRWKKTIQDTLGRLVTVVEDPSDPTDNQSGTNITTQYQYTLLDQLSQVDQTRRVGTQAGVALPSRTFQYDSAGRLRLTTQPETGTIQYTYDANGNPLTKTDGRLVTSISSYDDWDRLQGKSYTDGTAAVSYCYDGRGYTAGTGCTGGAKLEQAGKLTAVGTVESVTHYQFDGMGRVSTSTQTTNGTSYPFVYQYNQAGGLEVERYPTGREVKTCYDSAGRIASVGGMKTGVAVQYAKVDSYWPHGAVNTMKLADANVVNPLTAVAQYNNRLQITQMTVVKGGTLYDLGLGYTAAGVVNNGNVRTQTVNATGARGIAYTQTYQYDRLNRLSGMTEGGTAVRNYECDSVGNCWVTQNTGLPNEGFMPVTSGWFNLNNRMVGAGYDGAGNQTSMGAYQMTYDGENRLKSSAVNGTTYSYVYDGEGRRVMKKRGGVVEKVYVSDASGQVAAEYEMGGGTVGCGTCYRFSDHLGSTRMVTDGNGGVWELRDYLPYGEEMAGGVNGRGMIYGETWAGANLRFTGKERDAETGLDFSQARYISAAQGRFTSPDPSNLSVDFWVPQSWNRYSYALNNPLAYVDRNGLWPTWIHNQIINEAFPGLSAQQLQTLRTASHDTDYKNKVIGFSPQDPAVSFVHSMSNGTDPDEAHALGLSMQLADQFVQSNEAKARVAQAEWIASGHTGVSPNALTAFGNALHTVTDATSPEHAGFKRWSGAWLPAVSHVAREFRFSLTGGERANAINAARSALLNTFGWQLYYQATGERPLKPKVTSKIKFGQPVDNPDDDQNQ